MLTSSGHSLRKKLTFVGLSSVVEVVYHHSITEPNLTNAVWSFVFSSMLVPIPAVLCPLGGESIHSESMDKHGFP